MVASSTVIAGRTIDGSGSPPTRRVLYTVHAGVIERVDTGVDTKDCDIIHSVDLSHCTILPPLIDCSVQLLADPALGSEDGSKKNPEAGIDKKSRLMKNLGYCHAHGVLGVMDGNNLDEFENILPFINKEIPSLNIRFSKQSISSGEIVHKIRYSNDIDIRPGDPARVNVEEQFVLQAEPNHRRVIAVVNGNSRIQECIEAGCTAIEQGYGITEETLDEMAQAGTVWIPSLIRAKNMLDGSGSDGDVCCRFSQRYVAPGKPVPGAKEYWTELLDQHLARVRYAKKVGVKIATGTGAGSPGIIHGESMVEEMKLIMRAGYSISETIECATKNGADLLGFQHLGQLREGHRATFLVTRGSVAQLPRKIGFLEAIYIDGAPCKGYQKFI